MKDRYQKQLCGILLSILAVLLVVTGCGQKKADDLTEPELGKAKEQTEKLTGKHTDEQSKEAEEHSKKPEEHSGKGNGQKGRTQGEDSGQGKESESKVVVYVCGAVKAPGVYELASDARVYEAISSAGGVRDDAAAEALNQARVVTDGERIYIPTPEELEKGTVDINSNVDGDIDGSNGNGGSGKNNSKGRLNINTAGREELKTLPGIGDSKADSIISYRESNGNFKSIEELMNVEGIKEGVFNKIKDSITA